MNTQSLKVLTVIILATGLSQPMAHAQQLNLTSKQMMSQRASLNSTLSVFVPAPDTGKPDSRRDGGSHFSLS